MASSEAEGKEGGAQAPPLPLSNPVDALVEELKTKKELRIRTRDADYLLRLQQTSVFLYYTTENMSRFQEPRFREWHVSGSPNMTIENTPELIGAILAEDSYEDVTLSLATKRGGRKLWSMCCATSVQSPRLMIFE